MATQHTPTGRKEDKVCPYCGANVFWQRVKGDWALFTLLNGGHKCASKVTPSKNYHCEQCGGYGVISVTVFNKLVPCFKCLYDCK